MARYTVLCIDEDAIFRETVKATLEDAGYDFLPAASGREGLECFFEHQPQAVIVDLKMPDMGGLEVLSTVVENAPEVPVIVVSGAGEMSDVISALRLGAWDFIIKSLRSISLLDLHLERALDKARLKRENRLYQENLESALKEKERYRKNLEITFKNIPDGIVTLDCEGRILESNSSMTRLFGEHCDLTCGLNFFQAFADDMAECANALAETLSEGRAIYNRRLTWPHLGKNGITAELTTVPFQEEEGGRSGAILLLRDVTLQASLEEQLRKKHRLGGIIGKSPKMQRLFALIRQLSGVDASVLVTGESGTGKGLVAEALHYNSPRRAGPLIKVNCSALSKSLLESELFGHARDAFPGAARDKAGRLDAAYGGAIILDAVEDIPLAVQAKLLRMLETGRYERLGGEAAREADVRLIAATNVDLEQRVADGLFRRDLYHRLKVMHVHMPPLRERREDLPLLIKHFLAKYSKGFDKRINGVSKPVMNLFLHHDWPGNVRELKHALEHACLLSSGGMVVMENLPPDLSAKSRNGAQSAWPNSHMPLGAKEITDAIECAGGNKSKAARLLGVNRKTLYRKMHKLGITAGRDTATLQGRKQ
jgi:PAS domain S-box-containing protein